MSPSRRGRNAVRGPGRRHRPLGDGGGSFAGDVGFAERGSHRDLYSSGGRYREMYDRQHGLDANLFLAPGEGEQGPAEKGLAPEAPAESPLPARPPVLGLVQP